MITKTFILGHAVTVDFDAEIIEPPHEGGEMEFDINNLALISWKGRLLRPCPSRLAKIEAEIQSSDVIYDDLCSLWNETREYMH